MNLGGTREARCPAQGPRVQGPSRRRRPRARLTDVHSHVTMLATQTAARRAAAQPSRQAASRHCCCWRRCRCGLRSGCARGLRSGCARCWCCWTAARQQPRRRRVRRGREALAAGRRRRCRGRRRRRRRRCRGRCRRRCRGRCRLAARPALHEVLGSGRLSHQSEPPLAHVQRPRPTKLVTASAHSRGSSNLAGKSGGAG